MAAPHRLTNQTRDNQKSKSSRVMQAHPKSSSAGTAPSTRRYGAAPTPIMERGRPSLVIVRQGLGNSRRTARFSNRRLKLRVAFRQRRPFNLRKSGRKPKLPWRFACPSPAGVTERTRLLKTEKPSDPRDRHVIFGQISDGQTCFELLQDFVECHAFFGKPTCQRPRAHSKSLGDNVHLCLAMRQQGRDGILDFSTECAGVAFA